MSNFIYKYIVNRKLYKYKINNNIRNNIQLYIISNNLFHLKKNLNRNIYNDVRVFV